MDKQVLNQTNFRRIRQQLQRLEKELTYSIIEIVEEIKKGNDDNILEFLTNRVYIQGDDQEGDALFGINLKTGRVIYTPTDDDSRSEMQVKKISQHIRLDILEDLCNGKFTTYKED